MLLIQGEKSFCCSLLSDQSRACCCVFIIQPKSKFSSTFVLLFEMASAIFQLRKNKSLDLKKELHKTFFVKYIITLGSEPEETNGLTLLEELDRAKLLFL